jgi:hypothetical protein
MSWVVAAEDRSAGQLARDVLRLALLVALFLGSGCAPSRAFRGRAPAPTLDAPDSPELADALSGTLTAVRYGGAATIIDLPSRRELRIDLGRRVSMVAGPDESGRIAYEARNPRWWEIFPFYVFTHGNRREALFVRSLGGGRARVLREYESWGSGCDQLQISRRGGRVLYRVDDDLRVYDVGGRELFRQRFHNIDHRSSWIDDDDARLHFERLEPMDPAGPMIPYALRGWLAVSIDLSTGEERIESDPPQKPHVASVSNGQGRFWGGAPTMVVVKLAEPRSTEDPRGELPGDLDGGTLEFESGATIYHGLAAPEDGAYGFWRLGPTEHSLRLGERRTGKTLNLVRRFEPGVWSFTDVRVDPNLLGEPAPLRR